MNPTDTVEGGWDASEIRAWMNTTLFNQLPFALQSMIKIVDKWTTIGDSADTTIQASQDRLFIPSTTEVGLTSSNDNAAITEQAVNSMYSRFTTANSSRELGYPWRTRTKGYNLSNAFIVIDISGARAVTSDFKPSSVVPRIIFCFCV